MMPNVNDECHNASVPARTGAPMNLELRLASVSTLQRGQESRWRDDWDTLELGECKQVFVAADNDIGIPAIGR